MCSIEQEHGRIKNRCRIDSILFLLAYVYDTLKFKTPFQPFSLQNLNAESHGLYIQVSFIISEETEIICMHLEFAICSHSSTPHQHPFRIPTTRRAVFYGSSVTGEEEREDCRSPLVSVYCKGTSAKYLFRN